jgi:aldehyde dehydrogenase (NAD+)
MSDQKREIASVPDDVETLRKTFRSGVTKPKSWRIQQLLGMQRLMREGKSELCTALLKDLHKSEVEGYFTEINLVEHEIQHMLDHIDEYIKPEKVNTDPLNLPGWSRIYKDPLGVCLIMGAWNYPVQLTLLPLVGCLAAGNVAVVKVPSDKYSKHTSRAIATLIPKYFAPEVVKVKEGDRDMTQAVLKERYDLIFFTGGCFVGQMVAEAAAKHLTPTVLELGGKSPCIIDNSADLTVAARRVAWGAFMNAGQTCLRPDYLFVHEKIANEFSAQLQKTVKDFYGTNSQESQFFGRLINERAFERVAGLVDQSKSAVAWGGGNDKKDNFIEPTYIDFGTDEKAFLEAPIMAEEIFGPILPVLRFSSIDQVIRIINSKQKPLSCYVFSTSGKVRSRILRETSSGSCDINDTIMHMTNEELPFGGVGMSGMGSYHGKKSFDTFSHRKSVLIKTNWLDLPQRYPPYTPTSVALMNFAQAPRSKSQIRALKLVLLSLVILYIYSQRQRIKGWLKLQIFKLIPYVMQYMARPNLK